MFHAFRPYSHRLPIALLCAGLLSACASQGPAKPAPEPKFAADWAQHAEPLLFHGIGRSPGSTVWRVPAILPRGVYRVIEPRSEGAAPELIDGYRVEVGGSPEEDIYLVMWSSYMNLEVLNEKYIDLRPTVK